MYVACLTLPPTIRQGLLNLPGATSESKRTAERLLEDDRQKHHCFWKRAGWHNHLSHHILTAYDLGAPASLLHSIFIEEEKAQVAMYEFERHGQEDGEEQYFQQTVTLDNWTIFLGDKRNYPTYRLFFTEQIATRSVGDVLEFFLFSSAANEEGVCMLLRSIAGFLHPLIQLGFGAEFGSDAMVAQGLAQVAVSPVLQPDVFHSVRMALAPESHTSSSADTTYRHPSKGHSLLSILRQLYDSDIMKPVMPFVPDVHMRVRFSEAWTDGRPEEIRRLTSLWQVDTTRGQAEIDDKVEELLWATTLLLASTTPRGRKPRLDFFWMHTLTMSLLLPSLLSAIPSLESKVTLLQGFLSLMLLYITARGRPRIDVDLLMSYTDTPRPPNVLGPSPDPGASALGDPQNAADCSPWPAIISSVLHSPDAHTLKVVRTLCYAAQRYGRTPPGGAIGAFVGENGRETLPGTAKMDGTIFIRAAGLVMDTKGWVSHGQEERPWVTAPMCWEGVWLLED